MNLYEFAEDLRGIMRGGSPALADSISVRQVAFWIRTTYSQQAGIMLLKYGPGAIVDELSITQRYNCIPVIYPAEDPCNCRARGLTTGKVILPKLLEWNGRAGVERIFFPGHKRPIIRCTEENVADIVTGEGQKQSIQRPTSAFFTFGGRSAFIVPSPLLEPPKEVKLYLLQADPFLNLEAGETEWREEYGEREIPYPDWMMRAIRIEALKVEVPAIVSGLNLKDSVNDGATKPVL